MVHKYDRTIDDCIAEIKASTDPERTRAVGELLATLIFACDSTHTLRDWDWHIAHRHVTEEGQHFRQC